MAWPFHPLMGRRWLRAWGSWLVGTGSVLTIDNQTTFLEREPENRLARTAGSTPLETARNQVVHAPFPPFPPV